MMNESPLTFRIAPWRPWLLAVAPFAVLAAVGAALAAAAGQLAAVPGILLGLAGLAALLLLVIGLSVRVSRWHVDRDGIGGRNNWLVSS